MTAKLATEILKALRQRKDIWLDECTTDDVPGCPEIRGVQLRRFKESSVVGADSYHPFQKLEWIFVGQSFCVETQLQKGAKPLMRDQMFWREAFESAGGLYIEARNIGDVTEVLGEKEPEPWSEYESRQTRVGKVLNAQ